MKPLLALLSLAAAIFVTHPHAHRAGQTLMKVEVEKRGEIVILLHTDKAPKTAEHIIKLVQSGFYTNQRFHKVAKEPRPYLIQVGDPASKTSAMDDPNLGNGGSGQTVPYEETGFPNVEGAVGLSTLNQQKNSGDSQFYILLAPSKFLDGNYTVFGQVTQGMDVVRQVELGDRVTSVTIVRN